MEELRLLGPVELRIGDALQVLRTPKDRVLLAILALENGRTVSADVIARRIWGEDQPSHARTTITSYLSKLRGRLRRALGGRCPIVSGRDGYRLLLDPENIDLYRWRRLRRQALAMAASGEIEHAVTLLVEGETLVYGEPLSGLQGQWVREMRASLEEELRGTCLERIELQLRLGLHGGLIPELQRLAAESPFDERITEFLMLALYRHGRATDALEVYRQADRLLVSDQGTGVGARLRELHERILRHDPRLGVAPRLHEDGVPCSLPDDLDDFTGREAELATLTAVTGAQVFVITGLGGVGKSALALRAAHQLTERFPDAQLHVRVHGHDGTRPALSAGAVLTELLRALGVSPGRIPVEAAKRAELWRREMVGRRAVIVLDDVTGLDQIRQVVAGVPSCRMLVTSRRRLAGLPDAQYLRMDMLPVDEARQLVTRISGGGLDHAGIDKIVRRYGGLPLALRIAAAHAVREAPSVFETEPAGPGPGDGPADMQVWVALDHSYRALTSEQRLLLRRLGMSPCPDITEGMAAALVAWPVEKVRATLDVLLDHHLLSAESTSLRIHDLVREFSRKLALDEDSDQERRRVLSRLVRDYLRRAESGAPSHNWHCGQDMSDETNGVDPTDLGTWMKREWRNALAVADYAMAREMKAYGARLIHAFGPFLEMQGHREEAAKAQEAAVRAARETWSPELLGRVLHDLGFTRVRTGHYDLALEHAKEALEIFQSLGDACFEAKAQVLVGLIHWCTAQFSKALAHQQEAHSVFQKVGDRNGEAEAQSHAGVALWRLGRYEEALHHLEFSLNLYRKLGNERFEAMVLNNIGDIQQQRGLHRDALRCYEASSAIFSRFEGVQYHAILQHNFGSIRQYKGDYSGALRYYRKALAVFRDIGDRKNMADAYASIGDTYLLVGDPEASIAHYQRVADLAQDVGAPDQHARALIGMADAHRSSGRYEVAHELYVKALDIALDISDLYQQAKSHEGMADSALHLRGDGAARIHWRQALLLFEELNVPEAKAVAIRLEVMDEIGRPTDRSDRCGRPGCRLRFGGSVGGSVPGRCSLRSCPVSR